MKYEEGMLVSVCRGGDKGPFENYRQGGTLLGGVPYTEGQIRRIQPWEEYFRQRNEQLRRPRGMG